MFTLGEVGQATQKVRATPLNSVEGGWNWRLVLNKFNFQATDVGNNLRLAKMKFLVKADHTAWNHICKMTIKLAIENMSLKFFIHSESMYRDEI